LTIVLKEIKAGVEEYIIQSERDLTKKYKSDIINLKEEISAYKKQTIVYQKQITQEKDKHSTADLEREQYKNDVLSLNREITKITGNFKEFEESFIKSVQRVEELEEQNSKLVQTLEKMRTRTHKLVYLVSLLQFKGYPVDAVLENEVRLQPKDRLGRDSNFNSVCLQNQSHVMQGWWDSVDMDDMFGESHIHPQITDTPLLFSNKPSFELPIKSDGLSSYHDSMSRLPEILDTEGLDTFDELDISNFLQSHLNFLANQYEGLYSSSKDPKNLLFPKRISTQSPILTVESISVPLSKTEDSATLLFSEVKTALKNLESIKSSICQRGSNMNM